MTRTAPRRALDPNARDTYVYRLYDADGGLLYVGASRNLVTRHYEHSRSQPWWTEVDRWRIQGPYRRADALRVERAAIGTEHPLYNVQHRTPSTRLAQRRRLLERQIAELQRQLRDLPDLHVVSDTA